MVQRAGEVIPQVVKPVIEQRAGSEEEGHEDRHERVAVRRGDGEDTILQRIQCSFIVRPLLGRRDPKRRTAHATHYTTQASSGPA